MSDTRETKRIAGPVDPDQKARRPWQAYLTGSPTLLISILLHILLAILAAFFIVQRIETKRKQNFNEVSVKSSSSAAAQAQHQKEMTKKQHSMTTPDITQRITTTGLSPITMPEISMPSDSSASVSSSKMGSAAMSGMGTGVGPGTGTGMAMASTAVQIDTSAIAASAFGLTNGNGLGLSGHFYDLKQTRDKKPTDIEDHGNLYYQAVQKFEDSDWPNGFFNDYYQAKQTLYLPQLFVPFMPTEEAPKAFGVDKECKSGYWLALYKGNFIVPKTGVYRFFVFGDCMIHIRVNHKDIIKLGTSETEGHDYVVSYVDGKNVRSEDHTGAYLYPIRKNLSLHLAPTAWMNLEEGHANDIQILIGDDVGVTAFWILVEEKDYAYHKTAEGFPLLPLFKVSNVHMPATDENCPPYDKRYMGWTVQGDDTSGSETTPASTTPDATPTN
jgi:hypothetical protein